MKKVGIFVLGFVLLFMSFSSAGFFGDAWGKITGEAVLDDSCIDSETESNYFEKGIIFHGNEGEVPDLCLDDKTLGEYSCDGAFIRTESYECPNGCLDGACVISCQDSDGGKDSYEKGVTKGFYSNVLSPVTSIDYCVEGSTLTENTYFLELNPDFSPEFDYVFEYFCDGTYVAGAHQKCPNGCLDGACVDSWEDVNTWDGVAQCEPVEHSRELSACLERFIVGFELVEELNQISFGDCGKRAIEEFSDCPDSFNVQAEIMECLLDENKDIPTDSYFECVGSVSGEEDSGDVCIDYDGPKNFYTKGKAYGELSDSSGTRVAEWEDYCMTEKIVYDFACESYFDVDANLINAWADTYECPNGCLDGACIEKSKEDSGIILDSIQCEPVEHSRELSACLERFIVGFELVEELNQISFGDCGKRAIEEFSDCPDSFNVQAEIMECLLDENKDIPTDSYFECVKGISGREDIQGITECDGCVLDDNCYPVQTRKNGMYCSVEDKEFVSQLEENNVCDNNFECGSNLCIDGECISGGMFKKMIEWFKNLFG